MLRLLVAVVLTLFVSVEVQSKTWRVPGDAGSIAEAAFLAVTGDTVLIAPGTYNERFTVIGKDLVIRGSSTLPEMTIIDGTVGSGGPSTPGNVVSIQGVTQAFVIENLTIRGGKFNSAAIESLGAAIYVNQAHPTIRNCRLVQNESAAGGGVAAYFFSRPLIEDCWIEGNSGGGIFIELGDGLPTGGRAFVRNCTVVNNTGFGISIIKGAKAEITNCTIAFNASDGVLAAQGNARVDMFNNIIAFNGGSGIRRTDTNVWFKLGCNNVFGNPVGEWVGIGPNFAPGAGSQEVDPMFVAPDLGDYSLKANSPIFSLFCAVDGCGAAGADVTCTTAVEATHWTAVKELYRQE